MRTHLSRRRARRLGRVLAGSTVLGAGLVLAAGPASAHVGIQEGEQHADSYAVISFGVPHGCDGSPTTKIRIQMPESIPTVTPTVNPGWDVEMVKEQLDAPLDIGEGRTLTERITEVDYTAKSPLPNELRDVLQLSIHIPADAAGTTLAFPVIQDCVEGSTDWTQIPAEGQDEHELEHPAPTVKVIAAEAEGAHGDEADEDAEGEAPTTTAAASDATDDSDDSGSSDGLAIAGLVTGVLGMGLGGGALAASRRGAAGR